MWTIKKEIILAAFFHDIGHLLAFEEQETKSMGGFGVMHHEGLSQVYYQWISRESLVRKSVVKRFIVTCDFSALIPKLVGNHIDAKRYNINKDPS